MLHCSVQKVLIQREALTTHRSEQRLLSAPKPDRKYWTAVNAWAEHALSQKHSQVIQHVKGFCLPVHLALMLLLGFRQVGYLHTSETLLVGKKTNKTQNENISQTTDTSRKNCFLFGRRFSFLFPMLEGFQVSACSSIPPQCSQALGRGQALGRSRLILRVE